MQVADIQLVAACEAAVRVGDRCFERRDDIVAAAVLQDDGVDRAIIKAQIKRVVACARVNTVRASAA